jgi:A/G-specific adenine glycosylase
MLPVKIRKTSIRKRHFTYIIIEYRGKLLMRKRGAGDIWNGLYDFLLVENKKAIKAESVLKEIAVLKDQKVHSVSAQFKHVLSHQHLLTRFVWIKVDKTAEVKSLMKQHALNFYSKEEISHLPKPVLITRYLHQTNYLE